MTDYDYVYIKGYEGGVDCFYIMKSDDVKLYVHFIDILHDYYDLSDNYGVQAKKFNCVPLDGSPHRSWYNYRDLDWALWDAFHYLDQYDPQLFGEDEDEPLETAVSRRLKQLTLGDTDWRDNQEVVDFVEMLKRK